MSILGIDIWSMDGTAAGAAQQQVGADHWRAQQMAALQAHGDGRKDATAAMYAAFNAIPQDPIYAAAARAKEQAEAYLRRTDDYLYLGFLCSMAGAMLLRLALHLHGT